MTRITRGKLERVRLIQIAAVVVATPTSSHFEIVKQCLLKDKDVLCEKPLTVTTAESEQLIELAAAQE